MMNDYQCIKQSLRQVKLDLHCKELNVLGRKLLKIKNIHLYPTETVFGHPNKVGFTHNTN